MMAPKNERDVALVAGGEVGELGEVGGDIVVVSSGLLVIYDDDENVKAGGGWELLSGIDGCLMEVGLEYIVNWTDR